jgi:UDP-N-acetylmuramate: L-alanyl-gamma-D-glutamyl-meso-diaminopimelate ligase
VLDDFAHHPTAIDASLHAVRRKFPEGRLWAVVEPRSWSLRRRVFQDRLPWAFDAADEVVVSDVYRADEIPPAERLDPHQLVADLRARGRSAAHLPDAAAIVAHLVPQLAPGDVVTIMTNGAFDGLHDRLLQELGTRAAAARHR